jgi:hypothetical protein
VRRLDTDGIFEQQRASQSVVHSYEYDGSARAQHAVAKRGCSISRHDVLRHPVVPADSDAVSCNGPLKPSARFLAHLGGQGER